MSGKTTLLARLSSKLSYYSHRGEQVSPGNGYTIIMWTQYYVKQLDDEVKLSTSGIYFTSFERLETANKSKT